MADDAETKAPRPGVLLELEAARAKLARAAERSSGAMPDEEFFGGASDDVSGVAVSASPPREPTTIHTVLERWRVEGPVVHEPTGIDALDKALSGGPTYGSRGVLTGAPDAAKTALLWQFADVWSARGIHVGFLAVDEEDSDLVTRWMQRRAFWRSECEERSADRLERMTPDAPVTIYLYDETWTIEAAAADLAVRAAGGRAALLVDSIQTATCDQNVAASTSGREPTERAHVTANMRALRTVATRHRLIAIATSEMNRNAYRNEDSAQTSNDMAAGAESRAIEYQARWGLALRSVKGEAEIIQVRTFKNKLGPGKGEIYLRIDRAKQILTETDAPEADDPGPSVTDRNADAVLRIILEHPGIGSRDLRARSRLGVASLERALVTLSDTGRAENRPELRGKRRDPHWYAVSTARSATTPTHPERA